MKAKRICHPFPRELVEALKARTPSVNEFLRECVLTIAEFEPEPIDNVQVSFGVAPEIYERARARLRGRMTLAAALRMMVVDFVEKAPIRQESLENYAEKLNSQENKGEK